MAKKHLYFDDYLKFVFDVVKKKGVQKPQCVICYKVLAAESMNPSKLKRHFEKNHKEHENKDLSFFKWKKDNLKKSRLDKTGQAHSAAKADVKALYVILIGEQLVLPCAKEIVRLMIGEEAEKKLRTLSLSDNTVQHRITEMLEDIKCQVLENIKKPTYVCPAA